MPRARIASIRVKQALKRAKLPMRVYLNHKFHPGAWGYIYTTQGTLHVSGWGKGQKITRLAFDRGPTEGSNERGHRLPAAE